MLRKFFQWVFKEQYIELNKQIANVRIQSGEFAIAKKELDFELAKQQSLYELLEKEYKKVHNTKLAVDLDLDRLNKVFGNIELTVDHGFRDSWAAISIAGGKSDFIRFINLDEKSIEDIARFLRNFDKRKIDSSPHHMPFFQEFRRKK